MVGATKEKFQVHQDLICSKSDFFKAAVSKEKQDGESEAVELPEQDPADFKIYLEAVYSRDMDLLAAIADAEAETDCCGDRDYKRGNTLIKLYILRDFLGDIAFKNKVIGTTMYGLNGVSFRFSYSSVRLLFDQTPEGCGFQKLMADGLARVTAPDDVDKLNEVCGVSCTKAVFRAALRRDTARDWPRIQDFEKYAESVAVKIEEEVEKQADEV